ncbi:glycosyltransferase [Acinetobacter soli]|uniref:glycosyltransferase n=1 Tax=Acinetobacter soli TaxID=487316 RepID=UPI000CE34D0E|nr:glycosyltransferase [Acinetobacter soli]PPB85794.1 hypothetical protein AsoHEU7_13010 [Acinetobacter soli]
MKKSCFVCFTSSNSVISDTFKEVYNEISNNNNVYFYASNQSLPEKINDNTYNFSYGKQKRSIFKILKLIFYFRKFVIKNKIDSIFLFSTLPINFLLSYIIPNRVNVTYYLHDPLPHSGEGIFFRFTKKLNDYFLSKKVQRIFISSEYIKKDLKKTPFKEIDSRVITLPLVESLVSLRNLESKEPSIIFFGRIEKYKGLSWFFDSLLEFGSEINQRQIPIYIIGKGNLPKNIDNLISKGFNIHIFNFFISNDELANLINKSKIAVFPYRDATGTSAIQTVGAMGLWPIVSNVGGLIQSTILNYSSVISKEDKLEFISEIIRVINLDLNISEISNEYIKYYRVEKFSNEILENLI